MLPFPSDTTRNDSANLNAFLAMGETVFRGRMRVCLRIHLALSF